MAEVPWLNVFVFAKDFLADVMAWLEEEDVAWLDMLLGQREGNEGCSSVGAHWCHGNLERQSDGLDL